MAAAQRQRRRQRQQGKRRAAKGDAQLRAIKRVALRHFRRQIFEAPYQQRPGKGGECAGAAGKAEQRGGKGRERQRQRRQHNPAQGQQSVGARQCAGKIVTAFRVDAAVQRHVGDLVVKRVSRRQGRGEAEFAQRQRAAEQQHPCEGQGDLQRRAAGERRAASPGARRLHCA
ncbi:hypothetical protein M2323_003438 [Rhodoblastus acidophilus]|uniref:hypothetical protein n=1 Tax=Rhodoblastus acidophilus TaxID=1074 RepID=UPI002224C5EA|nr:hypothetical protein [Rhodoblastus acidophilus]MCW2285587.1 hypothetical protein [Rhodoblastus acidophilus]MCW2334497.1 hypothetical protein [Rhodoblastus acidophilus]